MTSSTRLSTAEQQRMLNQVHAREKEACLDVSGLKKMMGMLQHLPLKAQLELFGEKMNSLPDFRNDLLKHAGGWPVGVNPENAVEYLELAFHQSQPLPYSMELTFGSPNFTPSRGMLMKRLNGVTPVKLAWYMNATQGSICPELDDNECIYPSILRHNFANLPYRKECIHGGKTHVAVGFVDLGFLFEADFRSPGDGPFRFVGYDSSPFAVAKTLVIWNILKQSTGEDESVSQVAMQIWYSSTWEKSTLQEFKLATSRVIADVSFHRVHDAVKLILVYWSAAGKPVCLKEARQRWSALHSPAESFIGYLSQKTDRIDMTRYELTGDFGLVAEPVCGNPTMFDCPEGTPPSAKSESVFAALNADLTIKNESLSIVKSAEHHVLQGIKRLRKLAVAGSLIVELHCKPVENAVHEIAALRPWTMSWSNVLDYFNANVFHKIARACSVHGDTVHYAYSMNWICKVYGTLLMDYSDSPDARKRIIKQAKTLQASEFTRRGWASRFRLPLPENPMNNTTRLLAYQLKDHFRDHFFNIGRQSGPCNLDGVHFSLPIPLASTASEALYFVWTYDEDITFNQIGKTSAKSLQSVAPRLPPVSVPSCRDCGQAETATTKLLFCGACHEVKYCSRTCQISHWSAHKTTCRGSKKL